MITRNQVHVNSFGIICGIDCFATKKAVCTMGPCCRVQLGRPVNGGEHRSRSAPGHNARSGPYLEFHPRQPAFGGGVSASNPLTRIRPGDVLQRRMSVTRPSCKRYVTVSGRGCGPRPGPVNFQIIPKYRNASMIKSSRSVRSFGGLYPGAASRSSSM